MAENNSMPTTAKTEGMSAQEREKLIKRKAQLEAAIEKGELSEPILMEMKKTVMQIEGQLGQSVTPGRAPVDAPEPKRYGGTAKKKKMMMGGKAYSNMGRKPMMYGGKAK